MITRHSREVHRQSGPDPVTTPLLRAAPTRRATHIYAVLFTTDVTFTEWITETALGAGLALFFGVAIPAGLRWLTRRRTTTNRTGQATVPW